MVIQRSKFKDLIFNWVKGLPDNAYIQVRLNDTYGSLQYSSCSNLGELLATLKKNDFIE